MGKGGGQQQPTQQNVVQTNLPEYARPYFENIMQRAQAESYRGYTPYQAERLAGFTPEQIRTQQETMGLQTPGQFGVGTGLTGAAGLGSLSAGQQYMGMATDPSRMEAFMSPYQQAVTDAAKRSAIRETQVAQQQASLGAARQGTYGGARQAIAQAERERGLLDRLSQLQAEGGQKAFERAQQAQQFGADLGLRGMGQGIQAGQTLGQLGQSQQQANLQRLTAQEAVGAQQRAFEQQRLDQQYADFLRQRDYPMEQLGYFSNLMRGVPVQLGSTQTTYAPPPSIASQVGGLGLAGLSIGRATGAFAKGGLVDSYAIGGSVGGPYELQSPKDIAMEYGGNKQKIAQAAQMGLVDPTAAVVAGMFIDKMRTAQQEEMAPQTTVAQEVMAAPQMAAGLGATPQAAMAPQMQQAQAPVTAAQGGLMALDIPDNMVPDEYAGGGIIAFANGGETDPIFGMGQEDFSGSMMPRKELVDLMTLAELQEYNRSGKIPPRLAGQVGGRAIDRPRAIQETKPAAPVVPAATPAATAPTTPGAPAGGPAPTQAAVQEDDFGAILKRIEGAMPEGKAMEGLEKEIQASREARKAEKTQAGWMSLATAGLNIAAGTSPFALVNLGKGLAEGLKSYADELKDQKKLDREDKKLLADIEKARRDEKRGNVTAAIASYEKARDRLSAEDRQRIAAEASRYAAETRDPLSMLSRMRGAGVSDDDVKRTAELMKKIGVNPVLGG
jgi:hypothetical protein